MLDRSPMWSDYYRSDQENNYNERMQSLYLDEMERFFKTNGLDASRYYTPPSGFLTQTLKFNGASLETPMEEYIAEVDY
eukprot:CAMPEP_0170503088 /NCGR_PEP_ID=MMETSP0208-20121228/43591_1 /TAXON_ID=197538 /ORGANISM="Strombidium inclinatum, Strain S3" /LENGTH=78 /DNA_ID=CAMNT_0010782545 /DNA_START=582 /DNA_END=818 /DNA_ORIENTATION=-